MGSTSSSSSNCSSMKCNCFTTDKHIQNTYTIRYLREKWIWSPAHDMALTTHLSEHIPKEITNLIKHHSFNPNDSHSYQIIRPTIQCEKYYSKQNELLKYSLCKHWYSKHKPFKTGSLLIALHTSNIATSFPILDCIKCETLPALQLQSLLYMNTCQQINR
eukprot:896228_1